MQIEHKLIKLIITQFSLFILKTQQELGLLYEVIII